MLLPYGGYFTATSEHEILALIPIEQAIWDAAKKNLGWSFFDFIENEIFDQTFRNNKEFNLVSSVILKIDRKSPPGSDRTYERVPKDDLLLRDFKGLTWQRLSSRPTFFQIQYDPAAPPFRSISDLRVFNLEAPEAYIVDNKWVYGTQQAQYNLLAVVRLVDDQKHDDIRTYWKTGKEIVPAPVGGKYFKEKDPYGTPGEQWTIQSKAKFILCYYRVRLPKGNEVSEIQLDVPEFEKREWAQQKVIPLPVTLNASPASNTGAVIEPSPMHTETEDYTTPHGSTANARSPGAITNIGSSPSRAFSKESPKQKGRSVIEGLNGIEHFILRNIVSDSIEMIDSSSHYLTVVISSDSRLDNNMTAYQSNTSQGRFCQETKNCEFQAGMAPRVSHGVESGASNPSLWMVKANRIPLNLLQWRWDLRFPVIY
ncbi:hypothetical protein G7Y89_g276 [Cudoniella acicularis]|uniref:Uncharacterized protein n=1 Tax=Cudoniella acicularis TaxID=354080 RepID=A0A8H4RYB1_9HELO|nr:hypothetical protein G7Y89_g276 [Cudoniella acicularis]